MSKFNSYKINPLGQYEFKDLELFYHYLDIGRRITGIGAVTFWLIVGYLTTAISQPIIFIYCFLFLGLISPETYKPRLSSEV